MAMADQRYLGVVDKNIEVLVVDASRPWAELLCDSFTKLGYEPSWCDSVGAAIARLEQSTPAIVCCEERFEDGDWLQLQGAINQRELRSKLVIVTDHVTPASAFEALRRGCDSILAKPASASDVLTLLGIWCPPLDLPLGEAKRAYLSRTVDACPSLAEASRQLAVDKRSLRRMLALKGDSLPPESQPPPPPPESQPLKSPRRKVSRSGAFTLEANRATGALKLAANGTPSRAKDK